jgi:S1-C subfamily serine protease
VGKRIFIGLAVGGAVATIAFLGHVAFAQLLSPVAERAAAPRAIMPRGPLTSEERNTIAIFENASRSVVFITTRQYVRDFFSRNVRSVPQGTGSGFVWDERGHIVTNFHVIRGAQEALIRLGDQRSFQARLVGASPEHDLAVLQIDVPENPPPPVAVGTSADLRVGQAVLAIGNPFGLDHTLTTGVVSALDRSVPDDDGGTTDNLIQTDAAINPGNSGGPLIDSAGRVIGINTMIYSPSGANAGVGFALPVDTINRVVPRLIAYGCYVRPTLGITANDGITEQLIGDEQGMLVLNVQDGSPAARAGIRATEMERNGNILLGDVIEAVDGHAIERFNDLVSLLDAHEFGDRVTVTVRRAGSRLDLAIVLSGNNTCSR